MGKSSIEWTDYTLNPWWGCEKVLVNIGDKIVVDPACENCYAEAWDKRCGGAHWGRTAPRKFASEKTWKEPLKWDRDAKAEGVRKRVFVESMGDILEARDDLNAPRLRLAELVRECPHLAWLLLTKRPENFGLMPEWFWELPNVWVGVTAAEQTTANLRLPKLLALKAKHPQLIIFLSYEPALGSLELRKLPVLDYTVDSVGAELYPLRGLAAIPDCDWPYARLDWVIFGGESGVRRRPVNLDDARSVRDQCAAAGVPFFMKQVDKKQPIPADLMIRQVPAW